MGVLVKRDGPRLPRIFLLVAVLCLALVGQLAMAGPVRASWSLPRDLSSPGQDAVDPQVAVDAEGGAVAVWQRFDGSRYVIQAAIRSAGGSFGAPVDLSAPGQGGLNPQVAVDPQGNAVAVWQRSNGSNDIIQAAARPAPVAETLADKWDLLR